MIALDNQQGDATDNPRHEQDVQKHVNHVEYLLRRVHWRKVSVSVVASKDARMSVIKKNRKSDARIHLPHSCESNDGVIQYKDVSLRDCHAFLHSTADRGVIRIKIVLSCNEVHDTSPEVNPDKGKEKVSQKCQKGEANLRIELQNFEE